MSSALVPTRPARLGWIDRLILGIAPRWGLRRVRSRATAAALARHYKAAQLGRRTDGWHRSGSDANASLARSLPALRELSRDLRRNNGWARRGVQVIGNNTVGWGIAPKPEADSPELARQALDIWRRWANSKRCDFDGRMPFAGLQRLVMETVVESGEALVLRVPAVAADRLPVPFRVRVLEPDYLATVKDRDATDAEGAIVQGVEFDLQGRRVAYWLYENHPGNARARVGVARVPASDVLHVYRVDRPAQTRGAPWLAAAVVKLNDFDDYDDALLMQQKIAACFSAFVENPDGGGKALGEEDEDREDLEALEPGHIQYLDPGEKVSFASPPSLPNVEMFSKQALRRIAVSFGVTYEDLTGDYSQVNFSSARMARLSHWANVHDWRWNMLIPQLCDGVWEWCMELAAAMNGWPSVPTADWAPPPMPMIEPDKEGLAYQRLVRTGAMTLYQMIRERGDDPDTHLAEIEAANAELDRRGIWLDSDPRRTSAAGLTQARVGAGGAAGGDSGDDASEGADE